MAGAAPRIRDADVRDVVLRRQVGRIKELFREVDRLTDVDRDIRVIRYQFCLYEAYDALRDLGVVEDVELPPVVRMDEDPNSL